MQRSWVILKPLHKKPSLDPSELLTLDLYLIFGLSPKIIEKCVAKQLTKYFNNNGVDETFQSTYKSNHSTKTAFIPVFYDKSQRKTKLINCVGDIDALKFSNKLKLNGNKLEVLVIFSIYRPRRQCLIYVMKLFSVQRVLETLVLLWMNRSP